MPQDLSSHPLARITPVQRAVPVHPSRAMIRRDPSPSEKAAIIVRLLLAEGAKVPLSSLPEHMQSALTEQMGRMRLVDRATLAAVIEEFLSELEEIGLSFPGGLDGALSMLDGHISSSAANRLASASSSADPWERIIKLPIERLLPVIEAESTEVVAVLLSRMPVSRSAELLGKLPGARARRVALAMSHTANIQPETVRRIGRALATELEARPPRAFETGPEERIGAILNVASAATREDVLAGLEEDDADFAERVRRSIFTFEHIPARIVPRDVPKILRLVAQDQLITALAGALASDTLAPVAEFLLSNMSQRLAQSLREEVKDRGTVKPKDAEAAMSEVIITIRQLEGSGEIALIAQGEEDS